MTFPSIIRISAPHTEHGLKQEGKLSSFDGVVGFGAGATFFASAAAFAAWPGKYLN